MPQLILAPKGKGKPTVFSLFKKITTIGSSAENDVMLSLPGVTTCHAHILYDGKAFVIS
jgi:hypothetical protein